MTRDQADLKGDTIVPESGVGRRGATALDGVADDLARELASVLVSGHAEIGEGVVIVDPPRFVYANAAFCDMTGYSLEELTAMPAFYSIAVPEEQSILRARLESRLQGATAPARYETRVSRKDGRVSTLEIAVRVIETREGVRTVSLVRDTTERHRTVARVIEAERLASLGRRLAEVAHEVANPLQNVVSGLEVLSRYVDGLTRRLGPNGAADMAHVRSALDAATDGAQRIRGLLGDLRTESRVDRESVVAVDLAAVLSRAQAALPALLRARGDLRCELRDAPRAMGTDARLVQVFVNLLTNAFQALEDGAPGLVHVEVAPAAEGRVVVTIADTGPGIPRDHLDRIFEPFFTTKPTAEGTGLGLAISLAIVRAFGGDLLVESDVGRGTIVRVFLRAA